MIRRLGALVLVATVAVSGAMVTLPAQAAVLVDQSTVDGNPRLVEVTLQSEALGRETAIRVLLPAGYDDPSHAASRYPVLYLLHGVGDDHTTWTKNTDVEGLVAGRDLIVVMPDGGKNVDAGWYSDHFDGSVAWEAYHIGELIPFVDATWRTRADRESRAIAGLSMGGFGTMSYAARHPHLFSTAGSFSGAVNTADGSVAQASAFEAMAPFVGTPGDGVWGAYEEWEVNWRTHNPPDLAANLEWTNLWLSTGNGVPVPGDNPASAPLEAGVYAMNVLFHERLDDIGKEHVWIDRGHGTHEWHYWEADLAAYLDWLDGHLATPPARPEAFSYRSAEPAFSAWGWDFSVDRLAQEFVQVEEVSAAGLTATGSGVLHVVTAPVGDPGGRYEVTDAGVVTADSAGRLRFAVDLGPANPERQYTVAGRAAEAAAGARYFITKRVEISALAAPNPDITPAHSEADAGPEALPATGGGPSWMALLLLAAAGLARVMNRRWPARR